MKRSIHILLLGAVFMLSACSGMNDRKADRGLLTRVKTANIDKVVVMPESGLDYRDQTNIIAGSLGRAIGAVAAVAINKTPAGQIAAAMEEKNISISEMVLVKFAEGVTETKMLSLSDDGASDAKFKLTVLRYGLTTQPFRHDLQPVVSVRADLIRNDGTVLWSKTRSMSNHSDANTVPAYRFDAYQADPELLRKGFDTACNVVVRDLVQNLKTQWRE
ncbi:hypothetical protein [Ralstonia sp. 1138]|uniref:hypothetical protein n=1 Tax=Ralstonia sp. 1138 TaxID=3156423 RepID=UPI003396FDA7